jgi:hypothetical protein
MRAERGARRDGAAGAGAEFPKNFGEVVRGIFKRLLRVLAHIYHAHYDRVVVLGEEAHVNTLLAHFVSFAQQFRLVDDKELAPLRPLVTELARLGAIAVGPDRQPPLQLTSPSTAATDG